MMGPLISFLESIAIAKAFGRLVLCCLHGYLLTNAFTARQNGYEVEPSQELVAIGKSKCYSVLVLCCNRLATLYLII